MKSKALGMVFVGVVAILLAGCDSTRSRSSAPVSGSDNHGHSHDDDSAHSHSHGTGANVTHDHGSSVGPSGGLLVEWGGGKLHVELKVDRAKHAVTAYLLGPDAKTVVPIDATEVILAIKEPKLQLRLKADPLEAETAGESSRFVGSHDPLPDGTWEGSVSGVVAGTPYSGHFKLEADKN